MVQYCTPFFHSSTPAIAHCRHVIDQMMNFLPTLPYPCSAHPDHSPPNPCRAERSTHYAQKCNRKAGAIIYTSYLAFALAGIDRIHGIGTGSCKCRNSFYKSVKTHARAYTSASALLIFYPPYSPILMGSCTRHKKTVARRLSRQSSVPARAIHHRGYRFGLPERCNFRC